MMVTKLKGNVEINLFVKDRKAFSQAAFVLFDPHELPKENKLLPVEKASMPNKYLVP